jgi:signal transduction histidine kinase
MKKKFYNSSSKEILTFISSEEIDSRNEHAALLNSQSKPYQALSIAEENIINAEAIGYTRGMARGLLVQCASLAMLSEYYTAIESCSRALELFNMIHDSSGEALSHYYFGNCYFSLGDFNEAQKQYQDALSKSIEIADRPLEDRCLNGIGNIYHKRGEFSTAYKYFQKSIAIKEELNDHAGIAGCGINLGNVHAEVGNYTKAFEHYTRSLQLLEKLGDVVAVADCSNNIGLLYYRQGNYSEAMNCFTKGIKLWRELHDRRREAVSLHNIANIYAETGELDKTLEYYKLALSIEEEIGDKHGEADTLEAIGSIYFEQKNYTEALEYTTRSLEISRQIGNKHCEAISITNLGNILATTGKYSEAFSAMQQGLELYREMHDKSGEADCLQGLAKYHILKTEYDTAIVLLNTALQIAEGIESKSLSHQIHIQFASAYSLAENYQKAFEHCKTASLLEREIFSKENSEKINLLQAIYEVETARHQSEIHRLKTIELAEANRLLQELNQQKSDFLTIASHDLKNPLSNVMMLSKLLRKEAEHLTAEEIIDFASDIQIITERMFKLVKKFLDVNALESGKITPIFAEKNISMLIKEIIHGFRPIAKNKTIQIIFDSKDENIIALTDEMMLTEIIDNLLSNALKYSPTGKTVIVRLRSIANGFSVAIQDQGQGISELDKKRLFKSFARLSALPTDGEDSSGLGLFITKKMVELLGGTIYCESTEGKGATFVAEIHTKK